MYGHSPNNMQCNIIYSLTYNVRSSILPFLFSSRRKRAATTEATTAVASNNTKSCKLRRRKRNPDDLPTIDLFLNPNRTEERDEMVATQRQRYRQMFSSMDLTGSHDGLFEMLWYGNNPCFDVSGLTSTEIDERSAIKRCVWKGVRVNCSDIFKMTPTDRGMCCAFNVEAADKLYKKNKFQESLSKLQDQDVTEALDTGRGNRGSGLDDTVPEVGKYKGLTLVLDAHTDKLAEKTVSEDFAGFLLTVTKPGEFPLVERRSHILTPGHEHFVSLNAINTISAAGVKSELEPESRNCYFPDEYPLTFHQNYSQAACLFECSLAYARETLGLDCSPWFFPTPEGRFYEICDPWDTRDFQDAMKQTPQANCLYCLQDCETTSYSLTASSATFRPCNTLNAGLTRLCKYQDYPSPPIWSQEVKLHSIPNNSLIQV